MIHGGNSSVLAKGTELPAAGPSLSAIRSNRTSGSLNSNYAIRRLGTSGSGTQFFHYQGKKYGHIIDPRSGWPADKVLSATVIAPTAEQADALSTAFYVLGVEGAVAYCEAHKDISALLVTAVADTATVELHPINLADDRWRVLEAGDSAGIVAGSGARTSGVQRNTSRSNGLSLTVQGATSALPPGAVAGRKYIRC